MCFEGSNSSDPENHRSAHWTKMAEELLAFVWVIHRWPVNSPHKWPVTRNMFPSDAVIMLMGDQNLSQPMMTLLSDALVIVRTRHWSFRIILASIQWRHNGRDSVSNHQPYDCLLNRLFRRRSKKTSKLRVTGLCVGNSPLTGEFPAQMASNAKHVSIWLRHHVNRWSKFIATDDDPAQRCTCDYKNKTLII